MSRKLLTEISQQYIDEVLLFMAKKSQPSDYPFNYMFNNQWRVVIPIDTDINQIIKAAYDEGEGGSGKFEYQPLLEIYKEVENGMYDSHVDFKAGRVYREERQYNKTTDEYNYRKVEYKIGKFVQRLISQAKLDGYNYQVVAWEKVLTWWTNNSEKIRSNFVVIISQHPIDVLRMSDFKGIQSCHSQGGVFFQCACEEAQAHGPVAYLLSENEYNKIKDRLQDSEVFEDIGWEKEPEVVVGGQIVRAAKRHPGRDIKGARPISRLRFREAFNAKFGSVALPERKIYGTQLEDFKDVVTRWAHEKQDPYLPKKISLSGWRLVGGSYEDTSYQVLLTDFFKGNVDAKSYDFEEMKIAVHQFMDDNYPKVFMDIDEELDDRTGKWRCTIMAKILSEYATLDCGGRKVVQMPDLKNIKAAIIRRTITYLKLLGIRVNGADNFELDVMFDLSACPNIYNESDLRCYFENILDQLEDWDRTIKPILEQLILRPPYLESYRDTDNIVDMIEKIDMEHFVYDEEHHTVIFREMPTLGYNKWDMQTMPSDISVFFKNFLKRLNYNEGKSTKQATASRKYADIQDSFDLKVDVSDFAETYQTDGFLSKIIQDRNFNGNIELANDSKEPLYMLFLEVIIGLMRQNFYRQEELLPSVTTRSISGILMPSIFIDVDSIDDSVNYYFEYDLKDVFGQLKERNEYGTRLILMCIKTIDENFDYIVEKMQQLYNRLVRKVIGQDTLLLKRPLIRFLEERKLCCAEADYNLKQQKVALALSAFNKQLDLHMQKVGAAK